MLVRSALAAIDYNENIHREIKLDATGEPRYKMKVRVHNKTQVMFQTIFCMLQVDRSGTKVVMVPQKEKKDYTFLTNIFDLCFECLDKGVIPAPEVLIYQSVLFTTDQEALRKRKHNYDKV